MQNKTAKKSRFVVFSPESRGKTMHHSVVEGPLNCLSVNRDCSQVVVAGRNVFKVFGIEEEDFVEKINLRVGRNLNLSFSASDVTWNPVEDHILASAATNGNVVTWNLNKSSRSKQDQVFTEHKRSVNRVTFHSNECHLLMSGSSDGLIKVFDLRKGESNCTFNGKPESVRDVQFDPHHYFMFAVAYENGNVQTWDMRNPSRWEKQFTAHNGPVFSVDWHPEEKNCIATAGRDKLIKIWDLVKTKNTHTVQTIASVSKIKWRPQRRYHIASCSYVVDFNINVWDIRRPYIPFAAFNEHRDVVTGIVWKQNDPHLFYSSGKDCRLYQHVFRDATRPADSANPVGMDINLTGAVAHATSDKISTQSAKGYSQTKLPSFFRRAPDRSEQFKAVTSILSEFQYAEKYLSMSWFVDSAKNYQLSGKSVGDLCEHNANVAANLHRYQVAQSWRILKQMYDAATVTSPTTSSKAAPQLSTKGDFHSHKESETDKGKQEGKAHPTSDGKGQGDPDKDKYGGDTSTGVCDRIASSTSLKGVSDDDSDVQDAEADPQRRGATVPTNISSGLDKNDFFFGEGNEDQGGFDEDPLGGMANGQEWNLPSEAFQLRLDMDEERDNSPDQLAQTNGGESPSSESEFSVATHHHTAAGDTILKQELLKISPFVSHLPTWQFSGLVCDMLHYYAEQGDVQMSVSVLIILGDKIKSQVDEVAQEQWFMSYIDLLGQFELWYVVTEVINRSSLAVVSQLNLRSTLIHTGCSRCGKTLQRVGWLCDRCKGFIHTCSICHLPVKGLFVWCQGCSHGGHLDHIREWLTKYKHCPTGCGHVCEYT